MENLKEMLKKELTELESKPLNMQNLELIGKLADVYKDLGEIKKMEEGGGQQMDYGAYREGDNYAYRDGYNDGYREGNRYMRSDYRDGGYRDGGYREGGGSGDYAYREGGYGRRYNNRMRENMGRMMDGMDEYEYGRDRYMHGGDQSRVMEGLDKLMHAMCMFVESALDFAETPQEKEIIRKHISKISHI